MEILSEWTYNATTGDLSITILDPTVTFAEGAPTFVAHADNTGSSSYPLNPDWKKVGGIGEANIVEKVRACFVCRGESSTQT